MTIRTLAGALAVSGLMAASLPAEAEAAHRHSRSCGHAGYSSRSYRSPRYSHGYRDRSYRRPYGAPRYYGRFHAVPRYYAYRPYRYDPYYDAYGYYGPYAYNGPYPAYRAARGHYHGRAWCVRPHLSIHLGF
jgi:hypothetical protein